MWGGVTSPLATAREYFERALTEAEARHDRTEARTIAVRLCEVITMQDFDEVQRLHGNIDSERDDGGVVRDTTE